MASESGCSERRKLRERSRDIRRGIGADFGPLFVRALVDGEGLCYIASVNILNSSTVSNVGCRDAKCFRRGFRDLTGCLLSISRKTQEADSNR